MISNKEKMDQIGLSFKMRILLNKNIMMFRKRISVNIREKNLEKIKQKDNKGIKLRRLGDQDNKIKWMSQLNKYKKKISHRKKMIT